MPQIYVPTRWRLLHVWSGALVKNFAVVSAITLRWSQKFFVGEGGGGLHVQENNFFFWSSFSSSRGEAAISGRLCWKFVLLPKGGKEPSSKRKSIALSMIHQGAGGQKEKSLWRRPKITLGDKTRYCSSFESSHLQSPETGWSDAKRAFGGTMQYQHSEILIYAVWQVFLLISRILVLISMSCCTKTPLFDNLSPGFSLTFSRKVFFSDRLM